MAVFIAKSQFKRIHDRIDGASDDGKLCYIQAINFAEDLYRRGKDCYYEVGSDTAGYVSHAWVKSDDVIYDANRAEDWQDQDLVASAGVYLPAEISEEEFKYRIHFLFDELEKEVA